MTDSELPTFTWWSKPITTEAGLETRSGVSGRVIALEAALKTEKPG